jgi:hypothetical protein
MEQRSRAGPDEVLELPRSPPARPAYPLHDGRPLTVALAAPGSVHSVGLLRAARESAFSWSAVCHYGQASES